MRSSSQAVGRAASSWPSSSLTAMRMAWKTRLAGWPAANRAWPPPPKVQSIATSPGWGSRRSTSSAARTGTWVADISTSMAERGGDVGQLVGEGGVVLGPRGAVPDLEALPRAGDDDLLAQARVLQQEARDHHAAGGIEVRVEGVGAEEARQLARLVGEAVHALQRGVGVGLEAGGGPDL